MTRRKSMVRTLTVHSARLVEAIDLVTHAAATSYERPVLNTIMVDADDKGVRLIATDNYRIAIAEVSEEASDFGRALILLRDVPLIKSILRAHKAAAELSLDPLSMRLTVTAGALSLSVRLLDGNYPDINDPRLEWSMAGRTALGINPKFIGDVTRVLAKQTTAIRIYAGSAPLSPVLVTAEDFREVIMPVRMAGEDRMLAPDAAA